VRTEDGDCATSPRVRSVAGDGSGQRCCVLVMADSGTPAFPDGDGLNNDVREWTVIARVCSACLIGS
jgi:hypothetical protein